MITNEQLAELTNGGEYTYTDLYNARERYRQIDADVLEELLLDNGMFSMIDGSPASVSQYNTAIALMEKLGFLDRENVTRIVKFLYSLPLVGSEERNTRTRGENV